MNYAMRNSFLEMAVKYGVALLTPLQVLLLEWAALFELNGYGKPGSFPGICGAVMP
jgi:hypothetical protein